MAKDTPNIEINVKLTSYHIANLLRALELIPPTGNWRTDIIEEIFSEMKKQGCDPELFYWHPNPGLTIAATRRHLAILEHREKYG